MNLNKTEVTFSNNDKLGEYCIFVPDITTAEEDEKVRRLIQKIIGEYKENT